MAKQQIKTGKLADPVGHYSQALAVPAKGVLVFVSGMTARGADGKVVGVGDVEEQTRQVCENIRTALEAAGGERTSSKGTILCTFNRRCPR